MRDDALNVAAGGGVDAVELVATGGTEAEAALEGAADCCAPPVSALVRRKKIQKRDQVSTTSFRVTFVHSAG
ncbi:MAG: hypothetical protein DMG97_01005 [Acidobacteria bacterium]|nr:MAG: hypothetical protein DMG98_01340 [Acidobacteriota bacterium]PYV72960.1 MAG: hypothetical protein DMG96_24595 [Acidobacteriota bacterium]PYV77759.1 MAG: hypothetical protein DMG97_01005 [Acidobacteriota bacterium]